MDHRLEKFVEKSLEQGVGREKIVEAAASNGWGHGEIAEALAAWAVAPYEAGIPVPKRVQKQSSDFFLYLGRFTACYACLWAVMDLVFAVINRLVPDPNAWTGSYAYETRWSVAGLSVILPLYIVILVQNGRALGKDPTGWDSSWRRFFFSLTRYASVVTGAGCAIGLIGGILAFQGNLNNGLQLGAVIAMCVILLLDYRSPLKPSVRGSKTKSALLWVALLTVLGLYVSGLAFALSHRETPIDPQPIPPKAEPVRP